VDTDPAAHVRIPAKANRRQSTPKDRRDTSRGGRRTTDPPPARVDTLWTYSTKGETYTCGLYAYEDAWTVWILREGELLACRDGLLTRAEAVEWSKQMRKQLK